VRLHKTGLWDKALIVVTVDEGDSFRAGDSRRDPSKSNLGDIAFIPLFVKLPGENQGRVVERHVTSLDILPTIASVLGVRVRWKLDGHSALAEGPGPNTVRVSRLAMPYDAAQQLRVRARDRKLRLFGSGSWGLQLAATGRYWTLVGKSVRSLGVSGSTGGRAVVDAVGSRLLRAFPTHSQLVPSPLAGTLHGVPPGRSIAVALNGRIACVSQVYRERGTGAVRFSALAAEWAFEPGRNSVRVFVVSGPVSSPQLREVAVRLSR
jgi:hypothetical protein